jgi:beta-phosphoglucomutase
LSREYCLKKVSMKFHAAIFDLDGVIVSTDEFHYLGWKKIADEEGIFFDRERNHRLRGVSRMESLEILLEPSGRQYTREEKEVLAARKNAYYRELLATLSARDILPGVMNFCEGLRNRHILLAIGSSSRNAREILQRVGLDTYFDAVADGSDISRSKPDPEVFLLAAQRLGVSPEHALVIEDAESGVSAALAAGCFCLGVGMAANDPRVHFRGKDLREIDVEELLSCMAAKAAL